MELRCYILSLLFPLKGADDVLGQFLTSTLPWQCIIPTRHVRQVKLSTCSPTLLSTSTHFPIPAHPKNQQSRYHQIAQPLWPQPYLQSSTHPMHDASGSGTRSSFEMDTSSSNGCVLVADVEAEPPDSILPLNVPLDWLAIAIRDIERIATYEFVIFLIKLRRDRRGHATIWMGSKSWWFKILPRPLPVGNGILLTPFPRPVII